MEFRLLGAVELVLDGRPVELGWRRERCLLGLLLLDAGSAVPTERLVSLLWDDDPPAKPRAALQIHVSRLRGRLAAAGAERHGAGLRRTRVGYLVETDPLRVDVHRFRHLVDRARDHADAAERARLLRSAIPLWRGAPLADVASDRLRDRVCAGLDELYLTALEECVEVELALGRHRRLVPELTELVAAHPSRERLLAALMQALHRTGRTQDALAAYERGRRRLADELGLDPGAEVRRVYAAILRDEPPAELLRDQAGRPAGRPAEQHEVRAGVSPPQRPAAPAPPAGRAHPVPAQLPATVPVFVGRERHLEELDRLLLPDEAAVSTVVVTGSGGVGKTALAVHWGQRTAARFPDGQLYADLRGYAPGPPLRPEEVLARFLRALGVGQDDVPVDRDEQAALYRTLLSGRRMLVVLDNAHDPEHVRPLLPGSASCRTLVTSRDRLGGLVAVEGASRTALDVLAPQEAHALLTYSVGAERVTREPDATAELARLCGFLPLALRTAGANLATHPDQTVAGYAAQLREGNRLAALRVDDDDRAAVTAAFDLSYQRLAEPDRRLFRRLGLVPGPDFTAEAAAALLGVDEEQAHGGLERLAAAHLCERRDPSGRYSFHDLLRLYAADRAHADESETERTDAVRRLLDRYLHRADAARLLYPHILRLPLGDCPGADFPDSTAALSWLDGERANLVDAVRHAADRGFRRTAWLLADTLRGYFSLGTIAVEWLATADIALAAATADGDLRAQAAARVSLGHAVTVGTLGSRHREQSRLDLAVGHLTAALDLYERAGWLPGQASTLHNLATVHLEAGDLERAAEYDTRCLAVPVAQPHTRAFAMNGLATVHHCAGRLDEALAQALRALELHPGSAALRLRAHLLDTIAAVHRDAGRYDEALRLARQARELFDGFGGGRGSALCLSLIGSTEDGLGHHDEAVGLHERALALARDTGNRWAEIVVLTGLSASCRAVGEADRAADLAGQALELAGSSGYRTLEGRALTALAEAHLALRRHGEALGCCERALALQRPTGHRLDAARTLVVLARALADGGSAPAEAVGHLREALEVFAGCGAHADAERVRGLLAGAAARVDPAAFPPGRPRRVR